MTRAHYGRAAIALAKLTVALTLFAVVAGVAALATRTPPPSRLLDKAVFFTLWAYLLGVPVTGALAVALGNRQTRLIRCAAGLLVLWLITALALSTMHF